MQPYLSVVLPIYNEASNLAELAARLHQVLHQMAIGYEVILVDDGSTDGSLQLIKDFCTRYPQFRYLKLSRNFGHQAALLAGMKSAKGQLIVTLDADLQDPPELIPELCRKQQEGCKVVYAQRTSRLGGSWLKKKAAHIFYRLLKFITQIDIPVDVGDFRLIHRSVMEALAQMPERNLFLRGQIAWLGFQYGHIEYQRANRKSGKPKYTYAKLFGLALNGISSFSNWPLRLASVSGFVVSGVAFLVILYSLYARFFAKENVPQGWASIMVSILFIGGIQLIAIGIIGEYISRLANDSRKRPFYIVEEDADATSVNRSVT